MYLTASDLTVGSDLGGVSEFGPSVGLLMAQRTLSYDDAMNLLRTVSRRTEQTINDLAAEVIDCGDLGRSAKRFGPRHRATG